MKKKNSSLSSKLDIIIGKLENNHHNTNLNSIEESNKNNNDKLNAEVPNINMAKAQIINRNTLLDITDINPDVNKKGKKWKKGKGKF